MPVSRSIGSRVSLAFPLEVEDGWPPVAVESLPFRIASEGYVAVESPRFVRDLSVGDVIDATLEAGGDRVQPWRHVARSGRTTVWLLRLQPSGTIDTVLAQLRGIGCNTVTLEQAGTYSIDVPESVPIKTVDAALARLDHDSVAVAFPSMRHQD
ncbi:DUF4265 domain-containing protein [Labilithrix luteola]|uniref:DUF4265 domain-containing protein n=1 Tax=Labilithrix luteola TaxID=1391654 RepID=UPI0011BAD29A|nr:DUF4265 domain-containing protein [Labilithrix luteola]